MADEEMESLKTQIEKYFKKFFKNKKKQFSIKEQAYFHELKINLINYILNFLNHRYILQIINNKNHNFTNITSLLLKQTCSFRGLVYINFIIENLISVLKFLFNFDNKISSSLFLLSMMPGRF